MRSDLISGLSRANNVISSRSATGATLNVSEGDVVRARVISVSDGEASLKTAAGVILHARLEDGVTLTPGTEVFLTVSEGSDETLVMSLNNAAPNATSGDPAVLANVTTLTVLGYEPDAATVAKMNELMQLFPDMSPEEAAFFAAQKLPPDSGLREAFRAMSSGEISAGAMLDNLKMAASEAAKPSASPLPDALFGQPAADVGSAPSAQTTPAPAMPQAAVPTVLPEAMPSAAELSQGTGTATAADSTSQNTAAPVISQNTEAVSTASPTPQGAASAESAQNLQQTQALPTVPIPDFGKWLFEALGAENTEARVLTGEALSGAPLLEGLSARTLEGMAESLTRIAHSLPEFENGRELFEGIAKFTEELFLKPREDSEMQLADKLRSVREELYVKLAYFSEAVKMSGAQSKDAVLEQTQKLMEHVRMLSGLDKFVCIQLPIQLGDQRQSAELYILKRERGGKKRIDPEDVRLLLALDLEHMGRLEAQVEIKGRDISLSIEVENEDVASDFRQNTTKLHKMLDGLGYKFTNSSVKVKKSETKLENALLTLLEPERGGFEVLV